MRIQYHGINHRIVNEYEWPTRGSVQEVTDATVAAVLLTEPNGRFEIADDEPLLELMSREDAGALLLHGVTSISDLVNLSAGEMDRLVGDISISKRKLSALVKQAGKEDVENESDSQGTNGGTS